MEICNSILSYYDFSEEVDTISLSYEERFMRRKKLVSDKGHEFLVDLDEMKSVLSNQAFKLESGKLITIKSKKENLNIFIHYGNLIPLALFIQKHAGHLVKFSI